MLTQERTDDVFSRQRIQEIHEIIRPYVRRTPVLEVAGSDFGLSGTLVFKLELTQHSGSFKVRGAFAHLLTRSVPTAGVVAASGGNHGAAVAFAAMKRAIPAKIFVPRLTSPEKVDRIRSYGADLVISGDRYADALEASELWAAESGAMPIHAYDQPETLLGQATLARELEEQIPALDTLLVAVGGGGLIGGVAAWYRERISIVGVEPETAPSLASAMSLGRPVDVEVATDGVASDSLGARRAGKLMFPLAQRYVQRVALIPDSAILDAQKALWKVFRIIVEPGAATAFAALLTRQYEPGPRERVGVVLCGANTTSVKLL